MGRNRGRQPCLNYWITFTERSISLSLPGVLASPAKTSFTRESRSDDASAIWISGDFYIRENSKTRRRPVSRSTDHSRFSASLLPTLVLQSTRLNRTNVGIPGRHVCKGASYSPDANPLLPPLSAPPRLRHRHRCWLLLLLSAREIRYESLPMYIWESSMDAAG